MIHVILNSVDKEIHSPVKIKLFDILYSLSLPKKEKKFDFCENRCILTISFLRPKENADILIVMSIVMCWMENKSAKKLLSDHLNTGMSNNPFRNSEFDKEKRV